PPIPSSSVTCLSPPPRMIFAVLSPSVERFSRSVSPPIANLASPRVSVTFSSPPLMRPRLLLPGTVLILPVVPAAWTLLERSLSVLRVVVVDLVVVAVVVAVVAVEVS
ncbi:hypothetical protein BG015_006079, partial [Linnemannia schmuckeri]